MKVVWDTVKKRIPEVKPLFEKMVKDLERETDMNVCPMEKYFS